MSEPPIKAPKKLIEVALPLDDINAAATREKSIRHGHPSTLHLWWARRPLAAARAVLFAQLVNDPGYERNLNRGVNKKAAQAERERLFGIIRELVKWENTTNEEVLGKARAEIWKSWRETCGLNKNHPRAKELFNPDKLPAFHDPFAGGGAIPLEAQRLGLEAWASDLNPVAVLINKAMIEIPPKFSGRPPVNPASREDKNLFEREWKGAQGLAEDVRYYGQWMRDEAGKRIGHLYPKVEVTATMAEDPNNPRPDLKKYVGRKLTVIAWLWARTVKSPNPAFAEVEVPLVSTFMLSTKAGKEAYVEPVIEGNGYHFTVRVGKPKDIEAVKLGTTAGKRAAFRCLMSSVPVTYDHIRSEGKAGRMSARLMAIVAEGQRGRVYLSPTVEHEVTARKAKPEWKPDVALPVNPRDFKTPNYGLISFADLFTPRQLVALTTFSDLVGEAMVRVKQDYLGARASRPHKTWHSRGYLPHWEAGKAPQSITFRLHDSLPSELLERWREELSRLPESEQALERRKRFEAALDAGHGTCRLRDPRIAEIVEHALLHFDSERYRLHAWCVMPNHVHVLATPLHGNSLSSILHSWKSFTAKEANRLLVRTGAFWQEEYFDRVIRDDTHFARVVAYIENNPVKAGLCERTEVWRFGSAWERKEERAGRPRSQDDVPLAEGGTGATAYAEAVGVYLSMAISKMADAQSSLCRWKATMDQSIATFGRQALPMVWDFSEANVFGGMAGDPLVSLKNMMRVVDKLPAKLVGHVEQADAQSQKSSTGAVVSTDPPYYDNIGYADLSDFFYVWLRRSLKPVFPELFATLAVPKAEELVATPYRHGGKVQAETFFLDGMTQAMHRLAEQAHPGFPVTIYYAFKQAETKGDAGTSSTGWDTFLAAVIEAGFAISGTWPMRTELGNRMIGSGTNALASSIILVCRRRLAEAPTVSRRDFLRELREALPEALEEMTGGAAESSPIAPVDLAQAAIGPGIAIFSRYAAVLNADGSTMSVHEALIEINRRIDEFQHGKVGMLDADSQFCVDWFESVRWKEGRFGEADVLARAKGTSVEGVEAAGVIESRAGKVRLYKPEEYPADWGPETDARIPTWEALHQLVRALRAGGETEAGELLAHMPERSESIRQLAYRLYTLCEHKSWAEDARAYNELITAWPGIEATGSAAGPAGTQVELEI